MTTGSLTRKRILLCITGGIAAYKCAELTRLLVRAGASVRVVMTPAATEFITPLTMQALSGQRVHLDLLDPDAEAAMGHIELARWADLVLVAPASADAMARIAAGMANDILTTLILATPAPIALAPAMNQAMWADAATQANLATIQGRGHAIWGPDSGEQACGDEGPGRMREPASLVQHCAEQFEGKLLNGLNFLITGGPTREAVDPVRYISNHSSGKMAYALAGEAASLGAAVTLISGPVSLDTPERVIRIDVVSAGDMLEACLQQVGQCDVFIGVAAVADYRVASPAASKIKKTESTLTLELTRNPDILGAVATLDTRPFVVGFAAETENLVEYGKQKLLAKNLDLLFANQATETFGSDNVEAIAITRSDAISLGNGNKSLIARKMLNYIASQLQNRQQ